MLPEICTYHTSIYTLILFQIVLKLFFAHQYFSGFGPFLRAYNAGIGKLIHNTRRTVKADFKPSLQHTDRCLILINDQFYRLEKDYYTAAAYLESMAQGYSGISTYNSQQNSRVLTFVDRLWPELWTKYDRTHLYYTDAVSKDKASLLSSLVGLKYLLSHWEIVRLNGFEKIGQEGDVIIYRNTNVENAASFYTRSVSEDTYEAWAKEYGEIRDILASIVITEEAIDLDVGDKMPEDLQEAVKEGGASGMKEDIEDIPAGDGAVSISLTSPGSDSVLTGTVDTPDDGILMIAVPFQDGWSADGDGEKTEIIPSDYCFSGLRVSAGRHSFTLRYAAPLFREGFILSAAAWVLWLATCLLLRRRQ